MTMGGWLGGGPQVERKMLRWSSYNGVAFGLLMYDTIWHEFDGRKVGW